MEKVKVTVRVAGREYTMSGTDSEEHIHRVAAYVDRKMGEISLATRLPGNMISVLTAMNIADELLKAQDENGRLRKQMLQVEQQMAKLRAAQNAGKPAAAKSKAASPQKRPAEAAQE